LLLITSVLFGSSNVRQKRQRIKKRNISNKMVALFLWCLTKVFQEKRTVMERTKAIRAPVIGSKCKLQFSQPNFIINEQLLVEEVKRRMLRSVKIQWQGAGILSIALHLLPHLLENFVPATVFYWKKEIR